MIDKYTYCIVDMIVFIYIYQVYRGLDIFISTMTTTNTSSSNIKNLYPQLFSNERKFFNYKLLTQVILDSFQNNKYNDIYDIVDLSHYDTGGDLKLETDDGNIKASLFWLAVYTKDDKLVQLFSDKYYDGNALGTYKDKNFVEATPLYVACTRGCSLKIIEVILLKNQCYPVPADPNIPHSLDGNTPLMATAKYFNTDRFHAINMANFLLFCRGADINYVNKQNGNTALHLTFLEFKNDDCLLFAKFLLYNGADAFNIKNHDNLNAIAVFVVTLAKSNYDCMSKKSFLRKFISMMRQNKHFTREHEKMIHKLFGALCRPIRFEWIYDIWKESIDHVSCFNQQQQRIYRDEKFLKIVGEDIKEFETLKDLRMVITEEDYLIQSILILQRIIGGRHKNKLILDLLYELLDNYDAIYHYDDNHKIKAHLLFKYINDKRKKSNVEEEEKPKKRIKLIY